MTSVDGTQDRSSYRHTRLELARARLYGTVQTTLRAPAKARTAASVTTVLEGIDNGRCELRGGRRPVA
jgi:hypothetical protein